MRYGASPAPLVTTYPGTVAGASSADTWTGGVGEVTDLRTTYMGLDLANPIIVGSCGLTGDLSGVQKCADAGAGAVVLKSIFEEQIAHEVDAAMAASAGSIWHSEAIAYVQAYTEKDSVGAYLRLISDAKKATDVPVIASIHCVSSNVWPDFAARAVNAGADALELNAFVLPSDPEVDGASIERGYFDLVEAVKDKVSVPVALKLGCYFSGLANTLGKLGGSGIGAVTLFNRFFASDIDTDKLELSPARAVSDPHEYLLPLRWISILHGRIGCDICATTGVHDAQTIVKLLLAGADTVQVVSALYKNGVNYLAKLLEDLKDWMEAHDFATIDDFRGKLSHKDAANPAAYERVQFMKFATGME